MVEGSKKHIQGICLSLQICMVEGFKKHIQDIPFTADIHVHYVVMCRYPNDWYFFMDDFFHELASNLSSVFFISDKSSG